MQKRRAEVRPSIMRIAYPFRRRSAARSGLALMFSAALAAGLAGPAEAAAIPPPNGDYTCVLSFTLLLGRISVAGTRLSSHVEGDDPTPLPFGLADNGAMTWPENPAFFHAAGLEVVSGRLVDPGGAPMGITFTVRNRKGAHHSVHCSTAK